MSSSTVSETLIAAISFSIGFGGLCTYFQTSYILADSNLSLNTYLYCKLLQGILCFINTLIFYPMYYNQKFSCHLEMNYKWIFFLILFLIFSLISIKCTSMLSSNTSLKLSKSNMLSKLFFQMENNQAMLHFIYDCFGRVPSITW